MPDLLSTAEAAAELGISPRRVRALIAAGRLPTTKIGRVHAIERADLERVRERKPGGPETPGSKYHGVRKKRTQKEDER